MAPPLLAVFGMAVVAGVGFTLGKRLVTKVIAPNWKESVEPWIRDQAEGFNRWSNDTGFARSEGRGDAPAPSDTTTTEGGDQ